MALASDPLNAEEKQIHGAEVDDGAATSSDTNVDDSGHHPVALYDDDVDPERALQKAPTSGSIASIESRHEQDAVERILSKTSSRLHRRDSTRPLPVMGGGRDYPPAVPEREPFRVDFDGPEDPIHPFNWPLKKKLLIGGSLGFTTLTTAWGSAIFASAVEDIAQEFHVANVVAILGVSLYVFGFASGPILWAPLSETYGRKTPILISIFGLMIFEFGVATAKDLQTIFLCRFFAGFIGAAPLAVVGAAFADMFNNVQRGYALAVFSGTVFAGPIAAPVVGGFISYSYLGWRWTQYITGIMAALALGLDILFYEETYHPIILCNKARELRRRTGNWGIYAPHEDVEFDINDIVQKSLSRPIVMLFTEPILFLVTLYTAFIYGILYLFLEAYPIVFAQHYHLYKGTAELPYLGLIVGELLALLTMVLYFEPKYLRAVKANGGKPVPEARLPPCIVGGFSFAIGLFWFGWTGNYSQSIHWAVPTVSGLCTGYGLLAIFLAAINYIVDSYLFLAASAIAANTFLRSAFGAAFPLFAGFMFNSLGIQWASTLLGCVALVLCPVPIFFYVYGKKLRQRSKYAFDLG